MEQFSCAPEHCVFVGDSEIDVAAARAAGMASVCVSFGYAHHPVETLQADCVIHDYAELEHALGALGFAV